MFIAQKLLSFLPQNNQEDPPYVATNDDPLRMDEALDSIVQENPKIVCRAYHKHQII